MSACGHAVPRTRDSEAARRRQFAAGVPPSRWLRFGEPGRSSGETISAKRKNQSLQAGRRPSGVVEDGPQDSPAAAEAPDRGSGCRGWLEFRRFFFAIVSG